MSERTRQVLYVTVLFGVAVALLAGITGERMKGIDHGYVCPLRPVA